MLNNVKHVSNKYKTKYHTSIILQMIYNVKQCLKHVSNKYKTKFIILVLSANDIQC